MGLPDLPQLHGLLPGVPRCLTPPQEPLHGALQPLEPLVGVLQTPTPLLGQPLEVPLLVGLLPELQPGALVDPL